MAMRLRRVQDANGEWVLIAVCAAVTKKKEGDVYLDDSQHYAIGMKYLYEDGGGVGDYGELMKREEDPDVVAEKRAWERAHGWPEGGDEIAVKHCSQETLTL